MSTVFVSDALDSHRIPFGSDLTGAMLGKAHYSWRIVSDLYCSGFRAAGREVRNVLRPEIYQAKIARTILGCREDDIHFAIKPVEHLRPLNGARNIFVCGWEFPEFSGSNHDANPFMNQLAVLSKADHVVCWTDYTATNLRKSGLAQAITLPPPVLPAPTLSDSSVLDLATVPLDTATPVNFTPHQRLGDVLERSRASKVLVSVMNPFDKRKQLTTMLKGFQLALREHPDALLLVKLIIDNAGTTLSNINEILPAHLGFEGVCPRIFFAGDILTKSQVHAFLRLGTYYLCTSSAEGLNLPLIEAMMNGVVPVSTWNTAMGTYLDDSSSICIESAPEPMPGRGHALAGHLNVTHFPPTSDGVAIAIAQACSQQPAAYDAMSAAAGELASKRFGLRAFVTKFNETF